MSMVKMLLIGAAIGAGMVMVRRASLPNSLINQDGQPFPDGTPAEGPGNPYFDAEHPWLSSGSQYNTDLGGYPVPAAGIATGIGATG